MHARLFAAFIGHAGAGGLGQTVNVISLDAELIFDVMAHFIAPGLGAEDACLELDFIAQPLLVNGFRQILRIRRRAAQNGGFQIDHELQLTLGIARRHGQRQTAYLAGTAVQTKAAREQAVAIGYLNDVFSGAAGSNDGARAAVFPQVDVGLRIESNHTTAGGAGGGVDTYAVSQRSTEQTIGIRIAQVGFGQERQLVQIVYALDVIGRKAFFFHLLTVVGHIVPYMLDLLDQTLVLQGKHLLPRGGFDILLIIGRHRYLLLCVMV